MQKSEQSESNLPQIFLQSITKSFQIGAAAGFVANALDHSDVDQAKAKEQLELMMKLADARLNTFEGELKSMFLDHDFAMKTSVPGKRALRFEYHVQVDTETAVRQLPIHCYDIWTTDDWW
jgi:hypothetical protein